MRASIETELRRCALSKLSHRQITLRQYVCRPYCRWGRLRLQDQGAQPCPEALLRRQGQAVLVHLLSQSNLVDLSGQSLLEGPVDRRDLRARRKPVLCLTVARDLSE